jgi:hypothetical protein
MKRKTKDRAGSRLARAAGIAACSLLLMTGCPNGAEVAGPVRVDVEMSMNMNQERGGGGGTLPDPHTESCLAEVYGQDGEGRAVPLMTAEGDPLVCELLYCDESGCWKGSLELQDGQQVVIGAVVSSEEETCWYGMEMITVQQDVLVQITAQQGYSLLETGPGTGRIFHEQANAQWIESGWRYLEAAPAHWYAPDGDPKGSWGLAGIETGLTDTGIGNGSTNTAVICTLADGLSLQTAAQLCSSCETGECSCWFLPSIDELTCMLEVLDGLGGFAEDGYYWSSNEASDTTALVAGEDAHDPQEVRKDLLSYVYLRPVSRF